MADWRIALINALPDGQDSVIAQLIEENQHLHQDAKAAVARHDKWIYISTVGVEEDEIAAEVIKNSLKDGADLPSNELNQLRSTLLRGHLELQAVDLAGQPEFYASHAVLLKGMQVILTLVARIPPRKHPFWKRRIDPNSTIRKRKWLLRDFAPENLEGLNMWVEFMSRVFGGGQKPAFVVLTHSDQLVPPLEAQEAEAMCAAVRRFIYFNPKSKGMDIHGCVAVDYEADSDLNPPTSSAAPAPVASKTSTQPAQSGSREFLGIASASDLRRQIFVEAFKFGNRRHVPATYIQAVRAVERQKLSLRLVSKFRNLALVRLDELKAAAMDTVLQQSGGAASPAATSPAQSPGRRISNGELQFTPDQMEFFGRLKSFLVLGGFLMELDGGKADTKEENQFFALDPVAWFGRVISHFIVGDHHTRSIPQWVDPDNPVERHGLFLLSDIQKCARVDLACRDNQEVQVLMTILEQVNLCLRMDVPKLKDNVYFFPSALPQFFCDDRAAVDNSVADNRRDKQVLVHQAERQRIEHDAQLRDISEFNKHLISLFDSSTPSAPPSLPLNNWTCQFCKESNTAGTPLCFRCSRGCELVSGQQLSPSQQLFVALKIDPLDGVLPSFMLELHKAVRRQGRHIAINCANVIAFRTDADMVAAVRLQPNELGILIYFAGPGVGKAISSSKPLLSFVPQVSAAVALNDGCRTVLCGFCLKQGRSVLAHYETFLIESLFDETTRLAMSSSSCFCSRVPMDQRWGEAPAMLTTANAGIVKDYCESAPLHYDRHGGNQAIIIDLAPDHTSKHSARQAVHEALEVRNFKVKQQIGHVSRQ